MLPPSLMVFSRCAYQYFPKSEKLYATLSYGLWKIIHSVCMFVYSYNMNVNGFKWCGMDSNGMFMRCPNGHRLLAIYPTSAQDTNCPIQHWQREWFKKPNIKKVQYWNWKQATLKLVLKTVVPDSNPLQKLFCKNHGS